MGFGVTQRRAKVKKNEGLGGGVRVEPVMLHFNIAQSIHVRLEACQPWTWLVFHGHCGRAS